LRYSIALYFLCKKKTGAIVGAGDRKIISKMKQGSASTPASAQYMILATIVGLLLEAFEVLEEFFLISLRRLPFHNDFLAVVVVTVSVGHGDPRDDPAFFRIPYYTTRCQ
jgi:hypothetical protein